jgi:hypothetical protein
MAINRPGQKVVQSSLVNALKKEKKVFTNNGAPTKSTSCNNLLDMFFLAGAARQMSDKDIINLFVKAYHDDKNLALKCLFWARDIRGGAGERRFFRVIWNDLVQNYPQDLKNIKYLVPEYGRWDDLFFNETVANNSLLVVRKGLEEKNGLLAKWLPRKGIIASAIRNLLDMTPYNYRKLIVNLSNTVEQQMCKKQWGKINYSQVPSVAINKYRKAFYRNDENRFTTFIADVKKGVKKINAAAIYPYTLVRAIYNGENKKAVEVQWDALPNYMEGSTDRIIPVCDTSGSMTTPNNIPMDVSLSLGVYISERNEGAFKNCFITFSATPQLHQVNGSLFERLSQIKNANAGYNTNLVAVFNLILSSAIKYNVKQKEMPTKVLIISDMEFDGKGGYQSHLQRESSKAFMSNYEIIEAKYRNSGYKMPTLIFWNVNGRKENVPATKDDRVGLVSGFSPAILKSILSGKIKSPTQLMLETIDSERYAPVKI